MHVGRIIGFRQASKGTINHIDQKQQAERWAFGSCVWQCYDAVKGDPWGPPSRLDCPLLWTQPPVMTHFTLKAAFSLTLGSKSPEPSLALSMTLPLLLSHTPLSYFIWICGTLLCSVSSGFWSLSANLMSVPSEMRLCPWCLSALFPCAWKLASQPSRVAGLLLKIHHTCLLACASQYVMPVLYHWVPVSGLRATITSSLNIDAHCSWSITCSELLLPDDILCSGPNGCSASANEVFHPVALFSLRGGVSWAKPHPVVDKQCRRCKLSLVLRRTINKSNYNLAQYNSVSIFYWLLHPKCWNQSNNNKM